MVSIVLTISNYIHMLEYTLSGRGFVAGIQFEHRPLQDGTLSGWLECDWSAIDKQVHAFPEMMETFLVYLPAVNFDEAERKLRKSLPRVAYSGRLQVGKRENEAKTSI